MSSEVQRKLAAILSADVVGYSRLMAEDEVFLEIVRSQTPLGREQTPEDVGKLAAFLCGDDARNITGQVIALDGGIALQSGG